MRGAIVPRSLGALLTACALSACGSSPKSPTAPEMTGVAVPTGPQVLRISYLGQCAVPDGPALLPVLYTRVTVTRGNAEWIARSTTPDAGDVELRFHVSGPILIAGSMPVEGSIKGVAIHDAGIGVPGLPSVAARANFGSDGRTTVNGFAFAPSALTPTTGTTGLGAGAITLSDNEGRSCSGTAFSWSLAAPP